MSSPSNSDVPEAGQVSSANNAHYGFKRNSRTALLAMGAMLIIFALAASLIPIGGAVIGGGFLAVESNIKRISHPSGGVITEILVKDGQLVEEGELLMRLDNRVNKVRATQSGQTVEQLLATKSRLEAEREGRSYMTLPAALSGRMDESAQQAVASEKRLFNLNKQQRVAERNQLDQRIEQMRLQLDGFEAQIDALQQQLTIIQPELDGMRKLWDKGLVTIHYKNQLERTAVQMQGQIASLRAQIAATNAGISETRQSIIAKEQSSRADAGRQLLTINQMLATQRVEEVSADDANIRTDIRAPQSGVIDKLAYTTLGDVVQPAQPIMFIVPKREQLVVEARIDPADIDRVHIGQEARVRLSAFSATTTPELPATVSFVAANISSAENTPPFYTVKLVINANALKRENLELVSGMPTEVFISTGARSLISYITKPLIDQFSRAFRD